MTANELREILQSDNKLTIKEVKNIIHELQQDCFWKICELTGEEFTFKGTDSVNDCIEATRPLMERQFYQGETNAFYLCLDLLDKVGDSDE